MALARELLNRRGHSRLLPYLLCIFSVVAGYWLSTWANAFFAPGQLIAPVAVPSTQVGHRSDGKRSRVFAQTASSAAVVTNAETALGNRGGGQLFGEYGSKRILNFMTSAIGLASVTKGRVALKSGVKEARQGGIQKAATSFCNLFALWLAISAAAGVTYPPSFAWVEAKYFTGLLGVLMFSVGIATTLDDFKACLSRPGAIAINFLLCFAVMPLLAFGIAKGIGANAAILAGMVLVGAINGGQSSNLCTLIAGGDVALSVLMTTSTTLGCIFMTPLICKLVLGAAVPVDAWGIVKSTIEVVLAPIFLGVGLNTIVPGLCRAVAPFTPVIGVLSTSLLVGASVANCAGPILNAGIPLQLGCLALHLIGGMLGFVAARMSGYDERTCRTVAIETSMKSSAFCFLLASLHFGAFDVRLPPAVSVVWMAIVGSVLAAYWKERPVD